MVHLKLLATRNPNRNSAEGTTTFLRAAGYEYVQNTERFLGMVRVFLVGSGGGDRAFGHRPPSVLVGVVHGPRELVSGLHGSRTCPHCLCLQDSPRVQFSPDIAAPRGLTNRRSTGFTTSHAPLLSANGPHQKV